MDSALSAYTPTIMVHRNKLIHILQQFLLNDDTFYVMSCKSYNIVCVCVCLVLFFNTIIFIVPLSVLQFRFDQYIFRYEIGNDLLLILSLMSGSEDLGFGSACTPPPFFTLEPPVDYNDYTFSLDNTEGLSELFDLDF